MTQSQTPMPMSPPLPMQPPMPVPTQSHSDLWRLIKLSRPSVPSLLLAVLLGGGAAIGALWFPMLTKQFIDQLGKTEVGWRDVVLLAAVPIVGSMLAAMSHYLLSRAGFNIVAVLRKLVMAKLLHLPIPKFDENDTGDRVSRVVHDCESISGLATMQAISFVSNMIVLVGSIVFLLVLDTNLTLTLLGCVAVAFAIVVPVSFMMNRLAQQEQDRTAKLSAILTHVFSEIRLVKAYTAEERERVRGEEQIDGLKRIGLSTAKITASLEPVIGLAMTVAVATILIYGASRVTSGDIGVGTLTAYILYIFNITTPLAGLTAFFGDLQRARGASSRIGAILQEEDEHDDAADRNLKPGRGDLEFRDVSFTYPGTDKPILRGVDLMFRPGTTTALVGISGSGKTTVLSLIERFYRPTGGEIAYDGRPITDYSLKEWRRCIGYVAQDAAVMPGTVRDNITYGLSEDFTDEQVRAAAEKAGALEFIEAMPQGFDSILIEQGNNVSGGQRQRLAIARMFLRNPEILILDEATSNLDSETEHQVRSALEALMKGRTNIIVAHRLFTVMHTDRIYFLEDGRISGAGRHSELLDTHPYYARLVERQFHRLPEAGRAEPLLTLSP